MLRDCRPQSQRRQELKGEKIPQHRLPQPHDNHTDNHTHTLEHSLSHMHTHIHTYRHKHTNKEYKQNTPEDIHTLTTTHVHARAHAQINVPTHPNKKKLKIAARKKETKE